MKKLKNIKHISKKSYDMLEDDAVRMCKASESGVRHFEAQQSMFYSVGRFFPDCYR